MLGYHHFSYWHCHELGPPPTPRGWPLLSRNASRRFHSAASTPSGKEHIPMARPGKTQRMLELSSVGFRPFGAEMVLKLGMIPKCTLNWTFLGRNIHNISGLCWEVLHSVTWILPKQTQWLGVQHALADSMPVAPGKLESGLTKYTSRSDSSPKHQASEFGVIPPAAGNSPTFHGRMPGLVCNAQAQPLQRRPGDCAMLAPKNPSPRFLHDFCRLPPSYVSGFICWSKYRYMRPYKYIYIYIDVYIHTYHYNPL